MNIIYRTTGQEGAINKALVHHKGEFYVASENTLLKEFEQHLYPKEWLEWRH
jgi:hypothetical protein